MAFVSLGPGPQQVEGDPAGPGAEVDLLWPFVFTITFFFPRKKLLYYWSCPFSFSKLSQAFAAKRLNGSTEIFDSIGILFS